MESCGMSCIKFLVFCFNLIFFFIGLGLCGIGGFVLATDYMKQFDLFQKITEGYDLESLQLVAIIVVVIGGVVVILSFLGCCGAYNENKCMLLTFATLLSFIFLAQVAVGIVAFLKKDEITVALRDAFVTTMEQYNRDDGITGAWDNIQKTFTCCGVETPDDWKKFNTTFIEHPGRPLWPDSCCSNGMEEGCADKDTAEPYALGCEPVVINRLGDLGMIIGGAAIGMALVQVLGVVFACCLAQEKKGY